MSTTIKVSVHMPEELYRGLRDFARAHSTNVSRICCAGASRELARQLEATQALAVADRTALLAIVDSVLEGVAAQHVAAPGAGPASALSG
ncbi:hypothetical protein [Rhodopseudomonas sp.]|uniref:hypothetical protein n=1 Tax=Rhodopseudomonas sp. TaxID=1078 RepID=UPI003B3A3B1D